jgi:hypothetical protein
MPDSTTEDQQKRLFELIAYCREQKVSRIKLDVVEIEFSQLAYAAEMPVYPDETIEQREARAAREQQDHEELLYHSSRP